ncbi:hypothetical protein MiTa_04712 [Microcystis aeruginosa NIES-4264]|nr:hypothetical protein MiTa_04712 [Microcystis aeruginosa NIES-4264]
MSDPIFNSSGVIITNLGVKFISCVLDYFGVTESFDWGEGLTDESITVKVLFEIGFLVESLG